MAVDLSTIFDQKVREFRMGNAPERFSFDFIDAANKVVKELSLHAHDQTEIANVGGTADSIAIDAIYHYVVADGISYFLALAGQKPVDRGSDYLDRLRLLWEDGRASYNMNIINTLQDTASNDVIGLGAVGSNDT